MESTGPVTKSLAACMAQPPEVSLLLFGELIESYPSGAHVPARALRNHGRAGALEERHLAPLVTCLAMSQDPSSIVDLAKALASYGRAGQVGAAFVVRHLDELNIVDDETFWTFDSLLYVLGYLGGDEAKECLARVRDEVPPRPLRAKDLYRGEWDEEARAAQFSSTIARTNRMAAIDDSEFVGGWTEKLTDATAAKTAATEKPKLSPWMTR